MIQSPDIQEGESIGGKPPGKGLFVACIAGLILVHLAILWSSRLLPFIDIPFRLAAATIQRYYADPSFAFSEFFRLDLFPKPNAVHLLFCGLKIFPTVEFANKVFYSLYLILFPLSFSVLVRRVKGNIWFSLFSFLLIYSYSVQWGFAEFTMAIPFILFFIASALRAFDENSNRSRIITGLLLLLLFFLHSLASLFALTLLFLLGLFGSRRPAVERLKTGAAAVPYLGLVLFWWFSDPLRSYDSTPMAILSKMTENIRLGLKANLYYTEHRVLLAGEPGKYLGTLFTLIILSPLILLLFRKWRERRSKSPVMPYALILTGSAFVIYFLLPHKLFDSYYLYGRFGVFIFLGAILIGSLVWSGHRLKGIKIPLIAACLIYALLWGGYFIDFNRANRPFNKDFLPEAQPPSLLGGLIYDNSFRGSPVYIHFPNYFIVWNKGIAATCVMDYSFGLIRRNVPEEKLPSNMQLEWIGRHGRYDGRFDGVDYLLVRGKIPEEHQAHFARFSLLRERGPWRLYRREKAPV